ncbi:TPA: phage tail tape measure protein [Enterobacter hormaechei subsp. xiangfangensis]|uniref:phage tail tape measure protein n=1 Tax=Enterobacter cloacae complex TaxID=354276 RepID=UPI00123B660D|nr:phage tail tape measure protein [Enterobacter hormaechei]MCU2334652.1 phage tail tape measure protein [Enterobacter hormaechei subsp. steigerwaltii]EHF4970466.1 phage tail tape measure protein [Enterobacter hormaechei]EHN8955801.1 phage tail tape measure protein [Enterobacter hormaechei]ELC6346246.1 phage tail tape measure protein [Enterobacter hormaechei]ELC6449810.1 phage tail tape measure protein [Enterobacter hormaechei]
MSNDIATISLRVNTSELERGNQALDRFQETASAAAGKADDLNSTFRTGIDNQKKNSESLKQQRQELQNLLNKISPVNKALDELDTIQESLAKFRGKGLVGDEDFTRYNSVLETTRAKLAQVMESETAEGRARIEQAQAAQRTAAAGKTFIDSLEEQVTAIGKTRAELLELKAAQLGVSDRAAPMIAKLKEQEEAWKSGAISAGQYRNAMRYLPMQITDIVTSLASGMPVYMVAIQQGGQLRDSFGGVGNALKAMLSMVTPARVAIGGLAGAVLIAAKAGSDYFTAYDEINKAIIRTGNIAGTSALQIMASSQSIAASTGATVGTVQSLMTELVGMGLLTQQQLEKAAGSTALAVQTGIVSAQDIAKAYKDIEKDPVKALQSLNEQYNFLTVSQLKHVDDLVKQKDQTGAVTQAMDLFGDTMAKRGEQAYDSLTPFGRLWLDIKGWASEAMQSIGQWVAELASNTLKEFNAIYYSVAIVFQKLNQIISSSIAAAINLVPDWAKTDTLQGWQDYNEQMAGAYGDSVAQLKKDWDAADISAGKYLDTTRKISTATTQKDREGVASFGKKTKTGKQGTLSAGDRSTDAAQAELLALQAQLRALQQHKGLNDTISQQRKDLWTTEAKFQVLEEASRSRSLTKQEKSLLTSKDQVLQLARQKALLGDQITAQEQLNKQMDTSQKYVTQMAEKQAALVNGAGMSDRQAQRELAKSQLSSGWINSGGTLDDEGYQKQLKAANDYYDAEDRLRGDWLTGAKKGWAEFEDSATNVYSQVQTITSNAFTGMASTLTDFFTTGKSNFSDFLTTFLKGTAQMLTQLALVNGMKSAFGGTAIGNFFGIQAWSGGFIPEYANGGAVGYTGDGGKYQPKGVVHGGEFVFTKKATSALGVGNLYSLMRSAQGYANGGYVGHAPMYGLQSSATGGVTVQTSVVVHNQNTQQQASGNNDAISRAYKQTIDQSVRAGIAKELQPGRLIWNAMKSR